MEFIAKLKETERWGCFSFFGPWPSVCFCQLMWPFSHGSWSLVSSQTEDLKYYKDLVARRDVEMKALGESYEKEVQSKQDLDARLRVSLLVLWPVKLRLCMTCHRCNRSTCGSDFKFHDFTLFNFSLLIALSGTGRESQATRGRESSTKRRWRRPRQRQDERLRGRQGGAVFERREGEWAFFERPVFAQHERGQYCDSPRWLWPACRERVCCTELHRWRHNHNRKIVQLKVVCVHSLRSNTTRQSKMKKNR